VHEASTALVRLKTQVDLKEASITDEEKNLATLIATYNEVKSVLRICSLLCAQGH
jgi:hypothetical protein